MGLAPVTWGYQYCLADLWHAVLARILMAAKLLFSSFIFGISFLLAPKAQSATPVPVEASTDDEYGDVFVKMQENGRAIERILHGRDARLLERLKVGSTLTQADLDRINTVVADARLQRSGEAMGHVYTLEELANYRVFINSLPQDQQAEELATLEEQLAKVIEAKARAATDPKTLSDLREVIAEMPTREQNRLHGLVLDQAEMLSKLLKNEKWWNSFWRGGSLGAAAIGVTGALIGVFNKSNLRSLQIAAGSMFAVGGVALYVSYLDRENLDREIAEFDRLIANEREDLALLKEAVELQAAPPANQIKAPN